MKEYDFGEKLKEKYKQKSKDGKGNWIDQWLDLDVYQTPKYKQSKQKAIELIEKSDYGINESDFWILMNKSGNKMCYTGLIISHNGCLKINDKMEPKDKFRPECASIYKDNNSENIVMQYSCSDQGILEFGEISPDNCKNQYPYAMVLKRLQDRVILKLSKIGFYGIYSEAESDDFKEDQPKKITPIQSVAQFADEELRDAKETEGLRKLKEALRVLGSAAEIDSYLAYKHNGKTRLDKINNMREDNKAEAFRIIKEAKEMVDPDGEEEPKFIDYTIDYTMAG